MVRLCEDALFFRSENGEIFVYPDGKNTWRWSNPSYFFSRNGTQFYEVHQKGYGGNDQKHHISFEIVYAYHSSRGELNRDGDTLILDGKTFYQVDSLPEIEVLSFLPAEA